ncbi:putative TIR domain, winged helix-turn-helix DNA-binding domain-containing protein [Rosa chinensis]|uniref:ADP-ribosyl cyclase/cyclic ADP-ribose hydrolase n=1 Tax=Rosa chinensis TaxID=74649 RepID=A0A2P6Q8Q3_ROSCH|nr:putative TIR domain, winged helix-turn-helix DNA-binding domain-containing protein [Rosa chinensis]
MAAASSCSDIIPQEKHDVFLSFRGEDTRNTFTSHLYEALRQKKIQTYIDDKLERGDEISPALLKAISESKLSVIIFSKNYASSTWCLDELVHILQCRGEQIVIPIFYGIDPSVVRKQSGIYADAFVQHEERFKGTKEGKVLAWRGALKTAADISGFDSQTIRPESDLVKVVVNDILEKLNRKLQIARGLKGLVGMEKHIQQVELLLCLNSLDVQIVGIWGMGGIGKTTIAEVVFDRLSSQFEACCFIANVRESEAKHGLNDLWNQILRTLLKEENLCMATPSIISTFARERLRRTKSLIVLDDVSELSQLEPLAGGDCNLFGPGSRILVTTRNKRIFRNGADDDKIYEVKELEVDEALELFHLIAFRNKSPPGDYTTFAKEVVDYARGNPLALKILASVFSNCRSKEDWESELDKVKKFPNQNIQNVLRLSYNGLHQNEKDIFLDIACYYKGECIADAIRMLDASGFCANAGIRLLIDMSLISIKGHFPRVEMHDLIQEMGQTIVLDECIKDPGQRSRLWTAKDVGYVLKHKRGTQAIECLGMSMDPITDLDINPSAFKKMHNLRLLKLQFERHSYSKSWVNKVHLPQGLKCLPQALRILHWDGYPLNSLPSKFCPDNLVVLHMQGSRLERLWDKGLKISLGSLKEIDLRLSKHLAEVPDLSESPNLERIDLEGCTSLVQLPLSFQHLAKLTRLHLDDCSNLKILPEMPGNLKVLRLDRTAIEELPSSIWCHEKLYELNLGTCKELKNIPSSTRRLNSLLYLRLNSCLSLEELPSRLRVLDLRNCKSLGLGSLPVELPSRLRFLSLGYCKSLGLGSLPVELPSGLMSLDLRNCKSLGSLPKLPWLLKELDAHGCTSLETVSSSMRTAPIQGRDQYVQYWENIWPGNEELVFINCVKLDQRARSNIMADAQLTVMRFASRRHKKWNGTKIVCPGNEIPKWVRYQSEGCSINIKLPPHWFRQGFLGYALCIVVAFNNYTPPPDFKYPYFCCGAHHKTNNGHKERCDCDLDISLPDDMILNSDHVFLWCFCPYFVRFGITINREDSEASFDFMLYQHTDRSRIGKNKEPIDPSTVRVKRCGVSLLYAQDLEKLLGGIDEDVVMEPKQVVEEEDFIIKTKRGRDESELSGSGTTASFKEEDNDQLPPQSSKRKINIM